MTRTATRHHLCLANPVHLLQVLKDPTKPKAKGNFWTVDVSRIPPETLKLQNTPISRQEEKTFAVNLAPYVYQGWPFSCSQTPPSEGGTGSMGEGARQRSPFSIDSLLSDFQEVGLCGKPRVAAETPPTPAAGLDLWSPVPIFRLSSGPPRLPWRPSGHLPALRSFSSTSSLSFIGSLSPNGREAGKQRPPKAHCPHTLAKRPRPPESSSSDSGCSGGCTPPPPLPPSLAPRWEQLPTSYTKCVAPNVVAPPSHSGPFSTFPTIPGMPFCSPLQYANPVYWELVPGPLGGAVPSSGLPMDLDQTMPPNKTVFDVWMTHPLDILHPAFGRPCSFPRSSVLNPYEPS